MASGGFWKPGASEDPPAAKQIHKSGNYRQRRQDHKQREQQSRQSHKGHETHTKSGTKTEANDVFPKMEIPDAPAPSQVNSSLSGNTLRLKFMQKKVIAKKQRLERQEASLRSRQEKWAAAEAASTGAHGGSSDMNMICVPDDTVGCEADYSTDSIANSGRRSYGSFNPAVEERAKVIDEGEQHITDDVMASRLTEFVGLRGAQVNAVLSGKGGGSAHNKQRNGQGQGQGGRQHKRQRR